MAGATDKRPNIVFFMTDQLRRDALGCYGNEICQTPNLDRLAGTGVCFDNAFTTSPVCSPARASILTGLYPHNHGVMVNTHIAPAFSRGLQPETPTFSSILEGSGYALDYIGKWHVHEDLDPRAFGFHRFDAGGGETRLAEDTRIEIEFANDAKQLVGGINSCAEEESPLWGRTLAGIDAMRERAGSPEPFFVRIDMPEPHFPCLPLAPYAALYDPARIPPWPNFADDLANKPEGHLRKLREWNLGGKDWHWWRALVARYYAVITQIDRCVGEVVTAIEDMGIGDETIFVFSTDHGDAMGSHGHFEKAGTMYDEIFRIPLIVSGPPKWIRPGRVAAFVRSLDLMPTFVEWGGARVEAAIDGTSLVPLMKGDPISEWPDAVYCEHHGEVWGYQSQRMVRTTRWKYVYDPHSGDELYDLGTDPGELANRAEDPSCADVLEEMKGRLLGWNDATGDMFRWRWVRWNFPEPVPPV